MSSISQTLYVNHICDKIGIQELRKTLFSIFSKYGTILEICVHKGLKRRGQAWITYLDIESAVSAKEMLDRYYIFDRPISVQFSKNKSQITHKISGSWNPFGRKAERISESEAKELVRGAIPKYYDFDMQSDSEEQTIIGEESLIHQQKPVEKITAPTVDLIPPNNVLFVQNLFDTIEETAMTLDMLFGQYRGFKEARTVPSKPEIAFVEFDTIDQASLALRDLNGTEIDENKHMLIQYAKG